VKESGVRNLTKTLAILSLLTPVVGYPLGIGDLKLHSALNQNLNAEIPLTLSAGEDAKDIKVSLASAAKFDEAGVPWTYFLSKIRFQTVVGSNGSAVIKVSSKEALKEPFLNLLVEVSWPKGSLYREFTVLVDPPSTYKQPLPIAPPSVSKPPVVPDTPVNTGKPSAMNPAPVMAGKSSVVTTAPFPPVATTAPAGMSSKSSSYGPIHKKETMWSIGVKFSKENGTSVEQMLMAVYEANPGAFNRNNVFGLMSGAVLQIPGRDAALRLSPEQAREAYALQKKAWKSGGGGGGGNITRSNRCSCWHKRSRDRACFDYIF
jgi:pilus assembly protein FimV